MTSQFGVVNSDDGAIMGNTGLVGGFSLFGSTIDAFPDFRKVLCRLFLFRMPSLQILKRYVNYCIYCMLWIKTK